SVRSVLRLRARSFARAPRRTAPRRGRNRSGTVSDRRCDGRRLTPRTEVYMRIAIATARILLGLVFFVLGLNGFSGLLGGPPRGGPAGQFMGVMAATHYTW